MAQENQQQDRADEELVPISEKVRSGLSNYRISLEKQQPDIIYRLYLEILKQYSFFNAFTGTADVLEIYMQQFWHTITYNLDTKTYFFMLDDQIFQVDAELLHDALQITLKDLDHPFIEPPPHDDIVSFINKLGYPGYLEQERLLVFDRPRLALLQVLWGMITNANVDYADLIWEDFKFQIDSRQISAKKKELLPFPIFTKLIIKYILSHHNNFVNKGEKDPIYGMAILKEMMSDEIKASADYFNYLAKSIGNQPGKGQGKGLITKKETGQSEEIADEEEGRLNERQTGLKSDEETLDHSTMKLNGVKNGPGEGSSMVLDIHGDQGASYGNLSSKSDDEEGFMSTDDEESQEKSDDERMMFDNSDADAWKKQAEKIHVADLKKKKSEIPPSPSQTLSSAEYG
ncbi:hypothetical protein Tco_1151589, partial [Tanacetum coccineum]